MRITCCAKCGSQDIERLAWVTLSTKQMIEFVDPNDMPNIPINYCNDCGGRCEVKELEYLQKYGSAYQLWGTGTDSVLIVWPLMIGGRVCLGDEGEVDLANAFTEVELKEFYEDMLATFPAMRAEVTHLFKPYVDTVKDYVFDLIDNQMGLIFMDCHKHFKTKAGDETPEQSMRLSRIIEDLANLITEQVKQNL